VQLLALVRPRPAARRTPLVGLVVLALVAIAVMLWNLHLGQPAGPGRALTMPWWVLAAIFGEAEVYVLHIQDRREAQTVSLSEIGLVLGLFFANPADVVLGRLIGPLLVFMFYRRQTPLKVAFNVALFLADSCLAVVVFAAVRGPESSLGLRALLGAYAAAAASSGLDGLATTVVIAAHEGSVRPRDLAREPLSAAATAVMVSTLALVGVYALSADTGAAWVLVVSAVLLLLAYRAYATLRERHLSLARLYHFSQVVSGRPEVDEVVRSVLAEAKELLHAERAEMTVPGTGNGASTAVTLDSEDRLCRRPLAPGGAIGSLRAEVSRTGAPLLIPKGVRDIRLRDYLRETGAQEMIIVPLPLDGGFGTISVADRMGSVRSFDTSDAQLLETVANHAGVALRNGQLIDRLRYDALHDALTGLPNRTLFRERVDEAVAQLQAGSAGFTVMLADLNGFKEVNDTLGHQYGDVLLCEVGARLVEAAGPTATVARLGGDEFAILLDAATAEDALHHGAGLVHALERPVSVEDLDVEVGASIGVALAPEHAGDAFGLLRRADAAMYAGKRAGRHLQLFEDSIGADASPRRLALVGELRQGIALGQLVVHMQPKASLASGAVFAAEALVRWQHPRHGLLPPDEFVPMAERCGLIRPLTSVVLKEAVSFCADVRRAGRELEVSVNLSARSLLDLDLADEVSALLNLHALPPQALTLEITESSILTNPVRTLRLLGRLKEMGVRLSVDDFGTGYSSLSHLKQLPIHEVKIDKSFVLNLNEDPQDLAIVRSIVDLGSHLKLDVVAEGVEDAAAWSRLVELGCPTAQGYYLSRPMPARSLPAWLASYDKIQAPL